MLKHELTRKKSSEEKAEVLNAFFSSVTIGKTDFSWGTQPTELEDKGKEQNEFLTVQGKQYLTAYHTTGHTDLWDQLGSTQEC